MSRIAPYLLHMSHAVNTPLAAWYYISITLVHMYSISVFILTNFLNFTIRWSSNRDTKLSLVHMLQSYRSEFDRMDLEEFIWIPFDNLVHDLPLICYNAAKVSLCRISLVYFHIDE